LPAGRQIGWQKGYAMKIYYRNSLPSKAKSISRELNRLGVKHRKIKCGTAARCDLVVFELTTDSETLETINGLFD